MVLPNPTVSAAATSWSEWVVNRNRDPQCHEDNAQVEPKGGISDVVFVVLVFFLRCQKLATVDLSPAGNTGPNHEPGGQDLSGWSSGRSGRGPIKAMSPTSTFNNCGNSSMRVWRRSCPTNDSLFSSGTGWPRQSNGGCKVRNFCNVNRRPPCPIRCCQNKTGDPTSRSTSDGRDKQKRTEKNDHDQRSEEIKELPKSEIARQLKIWYGNVVCSRRHVDRGWR